METEYCSDTSTTREMLFRTLCVIVMVHSIPRVRQLPKRLIEDELSKQTTGFITIGKLIFVAKIRSKT